MYIIQTNRNDVDFQSYMYQIKKQSWEEFKEYILSNEDFTGKIVEGTMEKPIITKPSSCKISELNINDDKHLKVLIGLNNGDQMISEYYLVEDDKFKNLLK
jgi:hypothetical protein